MSRLKFLYTPKLVKNMIYVGAASRLLGVDMEEVKKAIAKQMKGKAKAVEINQNAAMTGCDWARRRFQGGLNMPKLGSKMPIWLVSIFSETFWGIPIPKRSQKLVTLFVCGGPMATRGTSHSLLFRALLQSQSELVVTG